MNLHDVVTIEKPANGTPDKRLTDNLKASVDHAKAVAHMRANHEFLGIGYYTQEYKSLEAIEKQIDKVLQRSQFEYLVKQGGIPKEFLTGNALSKAAVTPKATLEAIRQLVDDFSMIAMPYDYLDDRAINSESYEMREKIREYADQLAKWFNVYVVSPVSNYSIADHISSEDMPIYASPASSQAFMAIQMSVPMFRELRAEQEAARKETYRITEQLQRRIDHLETQVKSLAAQVKQVHETVERQRAEEVRRAQAAARLAAYVPADPMLFAFPKKLSIIKDDGMAILGPCWGPDFDEILAKVAGRKLVAGQRKLLGAAW